MKDLAHIVILTNEELKLLVNVLHGYNEVDDRIKERVTRLLTKELFSDNGRDLNNE